MFKKTIAFLIYGDLRQLKTNFQQYRDFKDMLFDFNVIKYDFRTEKRKILNDFKRKKIDFVVKNAYGRGNEVDVEIFLEKYKIPFLGSGSKTTLIGTSKFLSKKIFRDHGVPVIEDVYIS